MMKITDDSSARTIDVLEKLRDCLEQLRQQYAKRTCPVVTLTYAQSIDGCIAPLDGGTLQLSNAKSQRLTHQLRALHDAILVGINTVICDDPRLTVRLASGNNPQPIVLDSQLRFPPDAKLLQDPCVPPIIVAGHDACDKRSDQLTAAGARVIRVAQNKNGLIDLRQMLPRIKQLGFQSVMIEGGAKVISNVLKSQAADLLLLAITPRFVGGMRAVDPSYAGDQFPNLRDVHSQIMDGDIVVWAHLQPAHGLNRDAGSVSDVHNGPAKGQG